MSKHDKYGRERYNYLQELIKEFEDTDCEAAKVQILANLGNFAYDPQNFDHLYRLNVIDLFLDHMDSESFTEHAVGGLCNLAADERNREYILNHDGINLLTKCLSNENEESVISAMTCLIQLATSMHNPETQFSIQLIECLSRYSKANNRRLSNLASVFLNNYCTPEQINEASYLQMNAAVNH